LTTVLVLSYSEVGSSIQFTIPILPVVDVKKDEVRERKWQT